MASSASTLAGRYRLESVIGRGGMSTVYRAMDRMLDRPVAVKILATGLPEDDAVSAARFEREARAAAALAHPGIATVYDIGGEDGARFIVMELVRGASLAAILRDEGPLGVLRAVTIADQVADVLSAAHAAGIIHRDVKPANVMIGERDRVKVLDFGIARAIDATALTQTVTVLGTAAYMSPEQALGRPADERSDIYALGCVLYAMLAGSPPFAGELPAAILHQQVNVEAPPLRERGAQVSPALAALVAQMLAKNPADRPASAAKVRERLRAATSSPVAGSPGTTAPTRVLVDPHSITTRVLRRPGPGAQAGRRRRLAGLATVAALVAAAAALIAFAGSSAHRSAGRSTKTVHSAPSTRTSGAAVTATTAPAPPAPAAAKHPPHGPGPPGHKNKHGDHGGDKHDGG